MRLKSSILWVLTFGLLIASCKKWDDHTAVTNQNLSSNLLQEIAGKTNLSKFYEYLQKSGLDKELASSKTFTVWAPTNDALQTLSPATIADSALLRQFLGNHIALQSFFIRNAQAKIRVPMLNGKTVAFTTTTFDEATIIESDKYVANGVLHVIDKVAPVLPNAWEFVNNTKDVYQQNNFILSLNFNGFDPAFAIVDSISSTTGLPIYRPGTGIVSRNIYNERVFNLKTEQKQYTYFVLNNAAYTNEVNKLKPYYVTGTTDSTTNISSYEAIKDLVIDSLLLTPAQWPDTLKITSKFGVTVPIEKSKIVQTIRLSNGIAYVMSAMNFSAKSKIPTIIIQGENPRDFQRATGEVVNVRNATFYRNRFNPVTGQNFNDIFLYGHGVASLNILYQTPNIASVKYKVSWVAVNDTIIVDGTTRRNPVTFNQRLAMGTRGAASFPYIRCCATCV